MFHGVLFDVDGVLINSGEMHRATWGAWADQAAVDHAVMFDGIHGERGFETIARVAPHLHLEGELEKLAEILNEHEHRAAPYPEAERLLLRYAGRCALVTAGPRDATIARFERLGLPIPSAVVTGADTAHGKPSPEPYLLGASLLGLEPTDCVVVEDAPAGVAAGKAAGCYVLGVTTSLPAAEIADADEVMSGLGRVEQRLSALVG